MDILILFFLWAKRIGGGDGDGWVDCSYAGAWESAGFGEDDYACGAGFGGA